ncbi:beta-hexosaminidase subunit alpha-like [Mercenaria mercenaria]|uniref:beta-hexosaminidase subunit alpha-like n=1 Tax=Mercenaria mercenaria TaxID=6596 RepID=UPI00234ECBBF|nr:beta-hexosaminidase subunit alpha-like [Mercenaria mercenaria]
MQFTAISVHICLIGLFIKTIRIHTADCISVEDKKTKDPKEPMRNNFVKPNVILTSHDSFDLNIDSRYLFRPGFAEAPFSTVGEPWPLPKYYKTEKEILLQLKSTFHFNILNKNQCDILTEAVNRYKNIIENHITEEHYNFPFNFNEQTFRDNQKEMEKKYSTVTTMSDLDIFVTNTRCGYPHLNMNESYQLELRPNIAKLTAEEVWGALRGLETFSQLLFRKQDTNDVYTKMTEIKDGPRFPHRGIMLDTARHFIYKNTIKDVLDGMAYNKLNVLHWHIVDDNSFPYQSEVFPKLSEKAAFHPSLVYSLKDIKEIVEYARYRGIRVIPEFDTPGHSFSWFGYPDIVSTCYQGMDFVGPLGPINPAQNETYTFMAKLFSEIYSVFPDTFVHLGGDELVSTCWATNPQITSYLQTNGGIPAAEARSNPSRYISKVVGYYFNRLIQSLQATAREKKENKAFIMWNDVLKNTDDIPPNSIIQIWIGKRETVKLVNERGYRAIYSSCWYLDKYKAKSSWFDFYTCEPSPYESEDEENGKLLGGEACMWTEYVTTDSLMTFMWPRASLPAERLWSPKKTTDITSAQRRLQEQRCRMVYRGLATGHISGPDYCLRPKNSLLGRSSDSSHEEEVYFVRSKRMDEPVGRKNTLFIHLSNYSDLCAVSVIMCLVGMYLLTKVPNVRRDISRIRTFMPTWQ